MAASKRKNQNAKTAKIAFELFAPRNKDVKLKGDWNDWKLLPMERGDDGVWRADVELADGDYEYLFEVVSNSEHLKGQTISLCDPTTVQFSPKTDADRRGIAKILGGRRVHGTYEWQHYDAELTPNEQLIIYELHVGDFRGGKGDKDEGEGNFQGVIEKLDYLTDLGVTAIQLLPVNETNEQDYWGYSQRSIFAVENTYGTPDDFCRLVDLCHERGLRVIHDAVLNHVNADAALPRMDYSYWFYEENPDEKDLQFGPKFNYEFHDDELDVWPAREYVINAIKFWMDSFHLDGVRFDSTRAVKHFELLSWFDEEMRRHAGSKPFYTIAEHLPQDPSITGKDGPLDAAWHDNFYRQLITTVLGVGDENHQPFITDEVLRLLDGRRDGFDSPYDTVHYLNNHDLERVMYLLGSKGGVYDDAAFRRNKLGAALLLTAPGVPMLWMGEEFGQATQKSERRQPLDWSLLDNERNKDLWNYYRHLIEVRKNNPALCSENFEVIANMSDRGVIAFKRWNDTGNVVIVAANLMPHYGGQIELPLAGLEDGRWREAIYNYEVTAQENKLVDRLGESDVKVYIKC